MTEHQRMTDFWRYIIRCEQNRLAVERAVELWLLQFCRRNAARRKGVMPNDGCRGK